MPGQYQKPIAQYESSAGHRRGLYCERVRNGWHCRFSGYGLRRFGHEFVAHTPQGLALIAGLRVHRWGGDWRLLPGHQFPVVVDDYAGAAA